ncbi:ATP-binding protein [Streptomyces aidingensis]|uniref:ATP-binding protein n=1 Tax=Streptomyces aidingensis TaxID=910347 RepID=UPI001587438F|nr:ATP-binding protein [Streptomyces aidingensis]
MRSYRLTVPNAPDSVRVVRDHVAVVVAHGGLGEVADTARLLVSELVTNTWRHTTGPLVTVITTLRGDRVTVSVHDGSGAALPTPREAPPEAGSGRGLWLVHTMASAWGVSRGSGQCWKSVWFELRRGGR